jgi:hypothetical protein
MKLWLITNMYHLHTSMTFHVFANSKSKALQTLTVASQQMFQLLWNLKVVSEFASPSPFPILTKINLIHAAPISVHNPF